MSESSRRTPLRPRNRVPSLSSKFAHQIKSKEWHAAFMEQQSIFVWSPPNPPAAAEERSSKRSTTSAAGTTLDDLPDAILIHILTFLPTTDAIKTSLLSRRWRKLWHQVPDVVLDFFDFCRPSRALPENSQLFACFIHQTLYIRRFFPLRVLRLRFHYADYHRHLSRVTSWIHHVVNRGVYELMLDFGTDDLISLMYNKNEDDGQKQDEDADDGYCRYSFNLSDIMNSKIGVLKLYHCFMKFPSNKAPISFSTLKSLSLGDVWLRNGSLQVLVSSCKNLEFLSLEYITCTKLEHFLIHLPKLKELRLGFFGLTNTEEGSLDIHAPNLQSFSLMSFYVGQYKVENMLSLVEGKLDFGSRNKDDGECWCDAIVLFMGVERLRVQNMCFDKGEWLKLIDVENAPPQYSAFTNLHHLELITGYEDCDILGIAAYLELSPELESLVLDYRYLIDDDEKLSEEFKIRPIKLNMPCLRLVKLENYRESERELHFVELLKINNVVLEKVVAIPSGHGKTVIELWKASQQSWKINQLLTL